MIRNVHWFLVALGVAIATGQPALAASPSKKLIIIGFDGMDPRLCTKLMDAGRMPHCAKMRDAGGFKPLGTSIPPQSPVAWASFITGANPGVHGLFDFIHRDPADQCRVYYSGAETTPGHGAWEVGDHALPLTFWPFNHSPTQTLLRRDGTPFWDYLDAAGIPVRIYDIPSNYPPSPSTHGHVCCLSGMGVPDLSGDLGGKYQYFAEDIILPDEEGGGLRAPLIFNNHAAEAALQGPVNSYRLKPEVAKTGFKVYRHPSKPFARVELPGKTLVLKEGEWSEWCPVDFSLDMPPFLPAAAANGMCRFYVQQVHPVFKLYVSPVNIDPTDPAGQKISEPEDFVTDIAAELGRFYTTGFQEDHKARTNKVFNDAEYHDQAGYVLAERKNLLDYARRHYQDGLLFFYFSSTDVQGHIFWWDSDEKHPVRSAAEARKYHQSIEELYAAADALIGDVVERYAKEATILVMSDHGFCNFRRQFNLNTWLRDSGYLNPPDCRSLLNEKRTPIVDWKKTKAYGIGLNGLYVNLRGRERDGTVHPGDKAALLDELTAGLLAVRDPVDGKPVVKEVYRADKVYSGQNVKNAPDLIVGYHRDYRASWATTLGDITEDVLSDNDSAWSADHCIAADEVPGVIFSNRRLVRENPSLVDLAPTILEEFGVAKPATMTGGNLFK